MDITSILKAWIKAQFLKCLSITEAEPNLPDAYKKKVYIANYRFHDTWLVV